MNNTWGIYGYINNDNGEVVYIGIDRNISTDDRHKNHMKPAKRLDQKINKILQDNPGMFEYTRLAELKVDSKDLAYQIETSLINFYKPVYNVKVRKS